MDQFNHKRIFRSGRTTETYTLYLRSGGGVLFVDVNGWKKAFPVSRQTAKDTLSKLSGRELSDDQAIMEVARSVSREQAKKEAASSR